MLVLDIVHIAVLILRQNAVPILLYGQVSPLYQYLLVVRDRHVVVIASIKQLL